MAAQEKGWDEFHQEFQMGLSAVSAKMGTMIPPMIYHVLARVQELVSVVPPQPDRNRAARFNNYVRTIGHFPRSAFFQTKTGKWRRKGRASFREQAQIRYTSQQSGEHWQIYVAGEPSLMIGTLQNETTYAGWVFGPQDSSLDPHQAPWHTETGWVSQTEAIAEVMPEIRQMLSGVSGEIVATLLGKQ